MTGPRLDRLRARLAERELSAALITAPLNVGYLSGFSGSTAMLLVRPAAGRLVTDSRYAAQARAECPGLDLVLIEPGGTYEECVAQQVRELGVSALAFESEVVSVRQQRSLAEQLPGVELLPVDDLVAPLRLVKDAAEIALIRQACALADRAFEHALQLLRPGIPERLLAAELEYFMKREGADREAFDTIVASGPRSALPHGRASDRLLAPGDLVTLDFGARWRGYHSDLTRTVVLGRASDDQRQIYGVVLAAQHAGIAAARAGAEARAVDAAAREVIEAAGYGLEFGHGLGHSLGRACHDGAVLNRRSEFQLAPGMVFTVEPGIYRDGWGGVRIEDDVLVTDDGCELLTHAPRELIELPT
jgi:Xaa-Pro aminopeptidase